MRKDSDLKDLVEEYLVSIEVGRHKQVSLLCSQISIKLVELLDDNLEKANDLRGDNSIISLVGNICDTLRLRGRIAFIYQDIIDFVRVQVSESK